MLPSFWDIFLQGFLFSVTVLNTLCMKVSSYYSHEVNLYTTARRNLVNPPYSFLFSPMTAGKYWCTCSIINNQKRTLDPWVRWQYFLFIDKFQIEARRQKIIPEFP